MARFTSSSTKSYGLDNVEQATPDDRDFNNTRLQKSIQYMETEGGGDPVDSYLTRVQAIDEHILGKFLADRLSFTPALYRRLWDLVQEVQDDVQAVNDDQSADDSLDESSAGMVHDGAEDGGFGEESADESIVDVLYRGGEDDSDIEAYYRLPNASDLANPRFSKASDVVYLKVPEASNVFYPEVPKVSSLVYPRVPEVGDRLYPSPPRSIMKTKNTAAPKAPAKNFEQMRSASSISTPQGGDEQEKRFLYGGPYNEPEVWHRKAGREFRIGDSLYAEMWESWRINRDLAKGRGKSFDVPPPIFEPVDQYDSGSRYKLPEDVDTEWSQDKDKYAEIQEIWRTALGWFNSGKRIGSTKVRDKQYVPRLTLPLIGDITIVPFGPLPPAGEYREIKCSDGSFVRLPLPPSKSGSPTPLPQTSLKKFQSTREAATRRDKSSPRSPGERAVLKTRAALAASPTPEARPGSSAPSAEKSGKRRPGRPPKQQAAFLEPTDTTQSGFITPGKTLSEIIDNLDTTSSKRKKPTSPPRSGLTPPGKTLSEIMENFETASSKGKRGRPAKKPKDSPYLPASESVDEDDLYDTSSPSPSKKLSTRASKASTIPKSEPAQSPSSSTKRKRDATTPATPSPKKAKTSPAKQKKKGSPALSSPRVAFAETTPEPSKKAVPSAKAKPVKSAIKKTPPRRVADENGLPTPSLTGGSRVTRSRKVKGSA